MSSIQAIDLLIDRALTSLATDPHIRQWRAKEHNWVNYFVFRHLVPLCKPGSVIPDPAQIAIEMPVPQPKGERLSYKTKTVRRDLVLWPSAGFTCWDNDWNPTCHPLAILEWKVHRPNRPKPTRDIDYERKWLDDYCRSRGGEVVGYAVEVDGRGAPPIIKCFRCLGNEQNFGWLKAPWLERLCG
jgi:hypothetical protein